MEIIKHELAPDLTIFQGNVLDILRSLPAESVQCVATSPPYFGLRNYELPPTVWGGDRECEHEWGATVRHAKANEVRGPVGIQKNTAANTDREGMKEAGQFCSTCSAWRGHLGLEPTPEMFVEHTVLVFREVRRILRGDGVCWVNWGDSFNGSGGAGGDYGPGGLKEGQLRYPGRRLSSLKPKDLVFIPERCAMALQADGWYARAKPPWIKANPMPESVTDRPGTAHENVYLFTKNERYFYDGDAVRVPATNQTGLAATFKRQGSKRAAVIPGQTVGTHRPDREDTIPNPDGRCRRTNDWWTESLDTAIAHYSAYVEHLKHIKEHGGLLTDEEGDPLGFMVNTKPFSEAHFAVWPEDLVEPMILAGTSPKACPKCLAPWERQTEKRIVGPVWNQQGDRTGQHLEGDLEQGRGKFAKRYEVAVDTTGWQPTCSCVGNDGSGKCRVLDIFHGSGTTGRVSMRLGRAYWGSELNPEYVQMSIRARLANAQTSFLGQL